jgi:hypothetical protein
MDVIQEKHERAVGDAFMDWYNKRNGTTYAYHERGANAYHERGANPQDLIYRSGSQQVLLEVTVAYYDDSHATMLWQSARDVPNAPNLCSSGSPDAKLIDSINHRLAEKSLKRYPPGCILVVGVYPDLTTAEEFEELIPGVNVSVQHPFAEIYVGGLFPASSSGSLGGYFWWRLSPTQQA